MRDFKKYEVWKISHKLVCNLYSVTNDFPSSEIFGLTSQLKRAAASIPTNIAEGCGRDTDADFNRFLSIAAGSANETEYLLILARDLTFITEDTFKKFSSEITLLKKKIYSLKQKLK